MYLESVFLKFSNASSQYSIVCLVILKKYILFKPGFIDRKKVSRKLANAFNVELSTAERLLPSGGFEIIKSVGIDFNLE